MDYLIAKLVIGERRISALSPLAGHEQQHLRLVYREVLCKLIDALQAIFRYLLKP